MEKLKIIKQSLLQFAVGKKWKLGLLDLGHGAGISKNSLNLWHNSFQTTLQAQLYGILQGVPPHIVVYLSTPISQKEDLVYHNDKNH